MDSETLTVNDLVMKIGEQTLTIMRLEKAIAALQARVKELEQEQEPDKIAEEKQVS